jgi:hypothetical protein
MSVFHRADGKLSRYPTTHDLALKMKSAFYDDGIKCTECGQMSVKYSCDHQCRFCVRLDAVDFYNLAKGSKLVAVDTMTGQHYSILANGSRRLIPDEKYKKMAELVALSKSDPTFTVIPDPCAKRPHYGLKRLGKCYQCTNKKPA